MLSSVRIKTICSQLDTCKVFADVGCDHGYCTEYMLKNGLCQRAVISDISAPSLKKAQTLLAEYERAGMLDAVCCDGLEGIPESVNEVLIAGMGGREIAQIMKRSFIPEKFVLQPMKNSEEVRRFLVGSGCKIVSDFTFRDGKFYDLIKGERTGGKESYTEEEFAFGRDNIRSGGGDFREFIRISMEKVATYLSDGMSEEHRAELNARLDRLKRIYHGNV